MKIAESIRELSHSDKYTKETDRQMTKFFNFHHNLVNAPNFGNGLLVIIHHPHKIFNFKVFHFVDYVHQQHKFQEDPKQVESDTMSKQMPISIVDQPHNSMAFTNR